MLTGTTKYHNEARKQRAEGKGGMERKEYAACCDANFDASKWQKPTNKETIHF